MAAELLQWIFSEIGSWFLPMLNAFSGNMKFMLLPQKPRLLLFPSLMVDICFDLLLN